MIFSVSKTLVSVVMTTYQREPTMVKRAIKSVLIQTHQNLELIIVDDSPSSYEQRLKVKKMIKNIQDSRIKFIQHYKNKGACEARNTGIKKSQGEYIMYFDDDDELMPNKIKYSLKKFHSPKIGLVYSQNYVVDDNNNLIHVKNKMHSGFVFKELIKENFVSAFPVLRRECFIKCGLFDPKMKSMQDYELWLRIAQKYKFEYVKMPLSKVYLHKGERISTNATKKIQGAKEIYRRYYPYLRNNRNARNTRLMSLAMGYARNKDIGKTRGIWIKAIRSAPYKLYFNLKYTYLIYKEIRKK